MAYDTFPWRALTDTTGDGSFAVNAIELGDGYEQRVPQGINNDRASFRVVVDGTREQMAACIAWVKAKGGATPFYWKPPLDVRGLYVCTGWSPAIEGVLCRVSLDFKKVGVE